MGEQSEPHMTLISPYYNKAHIAETIRTGNHRSVIGGL